MPADMLARPASRACRLCSLVAIDICVPGDPADSEVCCLPQGGDELMDLGDEWSVGFGLPLAYTNVEGILVVDEQVEVPRPPHRTHARRGQWACVR